MLINTKAKRRKKDIKREPLKSVRRVELGSK